MLLVESHIPKPPNTYIDKTADPVGVDVAGRKVYKHRSSKHPYYLVWDSLHGEIEVFRVSDRKHFAVYHPNGDYKSGPIKGRELRF